MRYSPEAEFSLPAPSDGAQRHRTIVAGRIDDFAVDLFRVRQWYAVEFVLVVGKASTDWVFQKGSDVLRVVPAVIDAAEGVVVGDWHHLEGHRRTGSDAANAAFPHTMTNNRQRLAHRPDTNRDFRPANPRVWRRVGAAIEQDVATRPMVGVVTLVDRR